MSAYLDQSSGDPTVVPPAGGQHVVASYADYAAAQHVVDYLSDHAFPVAALRIVGSDLQLVETITGRLTTGRAALAGAASGAWFGLLVGLLVGLFTTGPAWFGLVVGGVLLGALWGAIFGFLAHRATRGQRDFSSAKTLTAARYDLLVNAELAGRAQQLAAEAA